MGKEQIEDREFSISLSEHDIEQAVESVKRFCLSEYGRDLSEKEIAAAIRIYLERQADRMGEDLADVLTSPGRPENAEFVRLLDRSADYASLRDEVPQEVYAESPVFAGNREFSAAKFAAMVAYIASRSKEVYKTKLNKLLFYADFTNYYLYGQSISGARYVHLPYGPVPDRYESLLADLESSGEIKVERQKGADLISSASSTASELDEKEKQTLDWVLDQYGEMSVSSISELSHEEKAYRFTRTGEPIAYEYAKFFNKLPPQ